MTVCGGEEEMRLGIDFDYLVDTLLRDAKLPPIKMSVSGLDI